jgi:hypothetical protein
VELQHFKQLIKGVKEMRAHMAGEHIAGIQVTTLNSSNSCNPHQGGNFDDFLKEEGIYEAVHTNALKRALAEQLTSAIASH